MYYKYQHIDTFPVTKYTQVDIHINTMLTTINNVNDK